MVRSSLQDCKILQGIRRREAGALRYAYGFRLGTSTRIATPVVEIERGLAEGLDLDIEAAAHELGGGELDRGAEDREARARARLDAHARHARGGRHAIAVHDDAVAELGVGVRCGVVDEAGV